MLDLKKHIDRFAEQHLDPTRPLLLGVSGGADSLALFEIFFAYEKIEIAVAHVDHSWREESVKEAASLKEYIESKKVKFHLLTLDVKELKGNLEEASRERRYAFFKSLCDNFGYQGVATGHHAQDQEETVLKRLLEGAGIKQLAGIRPAREVLGVTAFRPFLEIDKEALRAFAKRCPLAPVEDPSNANPAYLRARMRTAIVPHLESEFGKSTRSNLLLFARNMLEIDDYLERRIAPYLSNAVEGFLGAYLDLKTTKPCERLEMKQLLKAFLNSHQFPFSRNQLELLVDLISEKKANKRLKNGLHTLEVDRGIVFIFKREKKSSTMKKHPLCMGEQGWEGWRVTRMKGDLPKTSSWRECWKGEIHVSLPEGEYQIGLAPANASFRGKMKISEWWSQHKVPAFLKEWIPVIWKGEVITHEFLTGSLFHSRPIE